MKTEPSKVLRRPARPNFEVEVQVMPSCGGGFRRLRVVAGCEATAIAQASEELGRVGIDRWSLVRVASLLN